MPINASIPLQGVPVQVPNVMQSMKEAMGLHGYQQEQERQNQDSETRRRAVEVAQSRLGIEEAKAQAEMDEKRRTDARTIFEKSAPGFSLWLREAGKDEASFNRLRPGLKMASDLGQMAGYLPPEAVVPDQWTPEFATGATQIADALDKSFGPKLGGGPQKMTEVGPDGKTYEFLVSPGGEEGKKYLQPAPKSSVDMTPQPMMVGDRSTFGVYNPTTKTLEEVQGGTPPKSASTPDQNAIEEAAQNIVSNPKDITSLRLITTMRGDQRMQIYNAVKRIKPDFDLGMIDRRIQFLNQYENPAGRARINRDSMNNILMHASDLSAVNEKYQRADARLLNMPINALASQYNPVYTEFMVPLTVLQNEIELYFAGGYAPHEQQKKDWVSIINGDATPKQIDQFVKSLIHVGLRRADTHNEAFKKNMGYDDPNLLTPEAVKSAETLGMGAEVKKFGSGGMLGITEAPSPQTTGGFTAKTQDGRTVTFKSGADRDAAVSESGGLLIPDVATPAPASEKVDWIWDPKTKTMKKVGG